jgi:hypothetical protein
MEKLDDPTPGVDWNDDGRAPYPYLAMGFFEGEHTYMLCSQEERHSDFRQIKDPKECDGLIVSVHEWDPDQ